MNKKTYILILFSLVVAPAALAMVFDHSQFDQILKAYVDDQGLVDYGGIAGDKRFHNYMAQLEGAAIEQMSTDGRLAFWINAYNAVTIDKVIRWKPKKSVRETGIRGLWISTKFFTSREHTVAGKRVSQDDIEHEILRKQFKDPRIHFAIVCASSSCPKLARYAFSEEHVQQQLAEETRNFVNSDRGIRIDYAENTLYLSKLFDWFAGDFEGQSGSVLAFIRPYLNEEATAFLALKPKIAYLRYDWALNAKKSLIFRKPEPGP